VGYLRNCLGGRRIGGKILIIIGYYARIGMSLRIVPKGFNATCEEGYKLEVKSRTKENVLMGGKQVKGEGAK